MDTGSEIRISNRLSVIDSGCPQQLSVVRKIKKNNVHGNMYVLVFFKLLV